MAKSVPPLVDNIENRMYLYPHLAAWFADQAMKHQITNLKLPFHVGWWQTMGPKKLRWRWGYQWKRL